MTKLASTKGGWNGCQVGGNFTSEVEDVGISWFANNLGQIGVGEEVFPVVAGLDGAGHREELGQRK